MEEKFIVRKYLNQKNSDEWKIVSTVTFKTLMGAKSYAYGTKELLAANQKYVIFQGDNTILEEVKGEKNAE